MKRKNQDIYRAVVAEIERIGGAVDGERFGHGSHRVIYWSIGERRFQSTVSRNAGNWRSIANAITSVRAKLREQP